METPFFILGPAIRELARLAAPPVCPDEEETAVKTSDWAKNKLQFTPTPVQAQVLDVDAKYLILCCNRQWGKTTTIALKALHRALTVANQSIVIISRTKLQAGILIERACRFAALLGYRIRRVLGHQFSLRLPNGSNIFAVAHNTDTSMGNTANVLIVDEAALVKDEVFFATSAFVGRTHGSIWLMSTPRRQAGFFYNIWHSRDERWQKIFSNIKDCPEIDRDFLAMQKRIDEIKYRQDFECEFLQPADRLFTSEMIDSMLKD